MQRGVITIIVFPFHFPQSKSQHPPRSLGYLNPPAKGSAPDQLQRYVWRVKSRFRRSTCHNDDNNNRQNIRPGIVFEGVCLPNQSTGNVSTASHGPVVMIIDRIPFQSGEKFRTCYDPLLPQSFRGHDRD